MKLHKIEIAKRQLHSAIDLYFAGGDYLSVITLAGAAEEIFGNLLRRQSKIALLDHAVVFEAEQGGIRDFKTLAKQLNNVRNALKHANEEQEDEIRVEHSDAIIMLGRAIVNYLSLDQSEMKRMVEIIIELIERALTIHSTRPPGSGQS
jgi:hypothetical protein